MASKKKWRQRYYEAVKDNLCEVQELKVRIRQKDEVIKQQNADFDAFRKDIDQLNLCIRKLKAKEIDKMGIIEELFKDELD